ncbi:MAG: hypothetical protein IPN72_06970 [Saprospiraceae bacterium]|nr:hypothetical protein [Saprospiraceae bacterium]
MKKSLVSVDGSYTNESVLKALDEKVVIIGRVRKDCKLHQTPTLTQNGKVGRNRVYGTALPTQECIQSI